MGWAQLAATDLENEHVLLRPVRPADRAALHAIAMDPEIWPISSSGWRPMPISTHSSTPASPTRKPGCGFAYVITDKQLRRARQAA